MKRRKQDTSGVPKEKIINEYLNGPSSCKDLGIKYNLNPRIMAGFEIIEFPIIW